MSVTSYRDGPGRRPGLSAGERWMVSDEVSAIRENNRVKRENVEIRGARRAAKVSRTVRMPTFTFGKEPPQK